MEILDLTLDQLTSRLKKDYGKGLFHAAAVYREIFKLGNKDVYTAREFEASPVLGKRLKDAIGLRPGQVIQTFDEDNLTKFITRLADGSRIESVIIPMTNHHTLCVSSQVGCRMGCRFCETGKMGLKRNLTPGEITGQVFNARFILKQKIKNIVFMGMGEPFDNFDNVIQAVRIMNEQKGFDIALRHITLSTAGLPRGIERLNRLNLSGLRLAVSINAADDTTRSRIMPVNHKASLESLKTALKRFRLPKRGCFLFEYILIKGLNDSPKDAIHLAKYIKPLPVRLNLIPCNPVEGFDFQSPGDDEMKRFADLLTRQGVFVIKRWSRGRSVAAGCGQLGQGADFPKALPHPRLDREYYL